MSSGFSNMAVFNGLSESYVRMMVLAENVEEDVSGK